MSYDIYIGETETRKCGEDHLCVERMEVDEAPSFPNDGMTGKGTSRHPSYSGWSDFCEKSGLVELFFDETNGLMRDHPGFAPIEQSHLTKIREAKQEWIESNPGKTPGFTPGFLGKENVANPDPILARLIWLEFWFNWALENCEKPAIYNR